MTTTTTTTATAATDADARRLPPLPADPHGGDGYDWIDHLRGGWRALACWGHDGWDLGEWPYAIVAVCSVPATGHSPTVYGIATYTEGDVTVRAYPALDELHTALDLEAAWHWRHTGNGPDVPEIGPLPQSLTGPYRTT